MPTVYSPPVETYIALADITLATATSSVTLTGFSQDYRDLVLVFDGKGTGSITLAQVRVNGDTGSNYAWVRASGGSVGVLSSSYSATTYLPLLWSNQGLGTTQGNGILQLMDYSATDKHKTALIRENSNNTNGTNTAMYAGRWASTTAITSITVFSVNGNFDTGTTLRMFGIES